MFELINWKRTNLVSERDSQCRINCGGYED